MECEYAIKGYKVPNGCHSFYFYGENSTLAVSETFIDACEKNGMTGVKFVWVPDQGRYDAPPFYSIIPEAAVLRIACADENFNKDSYKTVFPEDPDYNKKLKSYDQHRRIFYDREKLLKLYHQADSIGGNLTFVESIMDEILVGTGIPMMVGKEGMPDADFAYIPGSIGIWKVLIRKSAAEKLIAEGIISRKILKPVLYFDEVEHSLLIEECEPVKLEILDRVDELNAQKAKWLKKKRPKYIPTEKLALTTLCRAKREDSSNYNKPLKKAIAESLVGSPLECMIPYYRISNGGWISDEIEYFAYEDVAEETKEFLTDMEAEETILEEMPELKQSIVIGRAANGDTILLEPDGGVLRYDHEEPPSSIKWNTVFEFFFDNIEVMS